MAERFKIDSFTSRSRSRSPFRKNFIERPNNNNSNDKYRRRERSPEPRRDIPKNRVFVNNIPFECRWMELKDIFRDKVGDVVFVELYEDDNGKFKGCGVVEFKDSETAQKAVDVMHKQEVRGRQLNVKLDSGEYERRRAPERDFGRSGDGFGSGNTGRSDQQHFNSYGLNPEFLRSLGIHGPLNNKVFISNLDFKVAEKKLEEIFKIAGKLVKAELNTDNEGKSKGHGTAEYEHPLEAVQAISMFNGQRLYARIINVRMDKFADDDLPTKLPTGLHGIGKGLGVNGQPMQFNKNSNGPTGSFGFGMGMGSMGSGMSGGGMGVGSSSLNLLSPGLGLSSGGSLGLGSSLATDRLLERSSLGLGLGVQASSLGLGSSSMLGSSSVLGRSSLDALGRDSYQLGGPRSSGAFRDSFDHHPIEGFNSSSLSDTVLLGNLPNSFNWQALKERFRDVGEIRFAELKGPGNAIIRYSSIAEAQRAVDRLNGIRMDGRALQVRLY